VLSTVFYRASDTTADPDLWGHVRFGQDVLRSASIPSEDPYSYLSDREWINHEWLSEVVFALAYDHAGAAGLVCLKVAITLALFGLLYWHFCAHGLGVLRGGMLLLVVLLPTLVGLTTVRPHLFTYLGFGFIVMAIHATEHGRRRLLWAAPPLLALWANLHGGFVAGVGVLFLWLVLRLLAALWETRSLSRLVSPVRLQTAGAVAVACLATLLNPNGIDLLTFLGRTAAAPRPEIMEWQAMSVASREGATYLPLVALALFALLRSRRPHKAALTGILAFTALLPLQAVRHLPLFAIACGVLTAEHLADAVERSWPRDEPARGGRLRIGFTGLAFAGTLILILASIPNFACIRIDPKPGFRMPARAVALMKESQVRGNLAVFFDWGGYVIWHLAPNVRVSVDGRRETIYSPAALVENLAFLWGTGDWDALLDERPTDLVLMDKAQPCYNLMQLKPGWSLAHADSLGALFVRRSSPLQEALRQTVVPDLPSDGRGLCFP
jgi:hypothetical protein